MGAPKLGNTYKAALAFCWYSGRTGTKGISLSPSFFHACAPNRSMSAHDPVEWQHLHSNEPNACRACAWEFAYAA